MKAGVISLISGLMTLLTVLALQRITRLGTGRGAELVKSTLFERVTIASIVVSIVSITVLIIDKYLDRQAIKNTL
jgi:hypothetical protein